MTMLSESNPHFFILLKEDSAPPKKSASKPVASKPMKAKKTLSGEKLKDILFTNQETEKYKELLKTREQLPVYQFK